MKGLQRFVGIIDKAACGDCFLVPKLLDFPEWQFFIVEY
jgi:hypothetical protein